MATTYPLATLAASLSPAGISAPPYSSILLSLQASYQAIFGTDSYIAPDSQDGQLLAIVAKAISDSNDTAIALYNSYSPVTAQGVSLSNVVKINGISRLVSSNSQVNVTITGVVGSIINNGVVKDTSGNLWNLPALVVIPVTGSILVTATAQQTGAISAAIGTVTGIQTPTLGWQSVTNPAQASTGNPVETDAALRARQTVSVALPSLATVAGIVAGIKALPGVTQVAPYENDTSTTDANGLPAHSISMVVAGGVASDIANVIVTRKTPGTTTYGTTAVAVVDALGTSHNINFYVPTQKTITVAVSLHPLSSAYTTSIGTKVIQAITDYINALLIGQSVYRDRLFMPAQLFGAADSLTYNITAIQIAISPGSVASSDLTIAFNERAVTTTASVSIALV